MKSIIFTIILAFIFISNSQAQNKNNISVGFGYFGLAAHANISYERQVLNMENGKVLARVAYGKYVEWGDDGDMVLLNWAYLLGKNKNFLEFDLGLMTKFNDLDPSLSTYSKPLFVNFDFIPLVNVGYRYVNPEKHFMLRTGVGTEYVYFGVGLNF